MTTSLTTEEPLDLRPIPVGERPSHVLAAFDRLAPGDTLVITAGDTGDELLRSMQAERRGLFEWSHLRPGPPSWTIAIARRAAPLGAARGINEALSWDHDRLDALEAAAFQKRAEGDLQSAHDNFSAFAAGLRRHIAFEEQVLFPAFEEVTGMPPTAGPTAVMREEHREIEALISQIETGIADSAAPVEELRRSLHNVLGEHNLKEEGVLYPTTDQLLGTDEADQLVERIQRF
ncbi:MAG TPA: hemerythrin domain-containing protein [Thermoanaerobaculia bacterium]|nr:hemerythrin domain-containing protein [Thermoanaerobaculia bacterium]